MSTLQLQQLRPTLMANKAKLTGTLDQVRQGFEEMLTESPVAPGVAFEQETAGGVPASWCIPPRAIDDQVLLFLHGGGYVIGNSRAYRPLGSEFASRLRTRVLIPDYRLAPENPFPAALDDAVKVYRALLDNRVPAKSITFAGD